MLILFVLLVALIVLVGAAKAFGAIMMGFMITVGIVIGALAIFFAFDGLCDAVIAAHRKLVARRKRRVNNYPPQP